MDLLLGNALMRWCFINQQDLNEGLHLANLTTLPLGKSLIALNVLSDADLRTSVQVQSMLRDGILSEQEADRVMHLCRVKKISLSQALIMTGLISLSGPRMRLGQLLVDCGCLGESELPRFLQICQKTGLPLGTVLVNCRAVHSPVLDTVVRFQKLQRQTNYSVELETLKKEVANLQANSKGQLETDTRLGDLMLNAGIITRAELTTALSVSAANHKMLGEFLVEFVWITQKTLDAALELQQLIRDGQSDVENAADILRNVHITSRNLQEVTAERTPAYTKNLIFGKFLIISGFIDQQELETASRQFADKVGNSDSEPVKAKSTVSEDPHVTRDIVCAAGLASQTTVTAAMRHWQSARNGLLPLVKAIVVFAEQVLDAEQMVLSRLAATRFSSAT